jgi:Fic-DOC domain mobile mystery protein B
MGVKLTYPIGATPLDPDEAEGLIPRHISTQGQLNEWEHQNILEGQQWAFSRRRANLLTLDFMQSLHRRMFGKTWQWAGMLRLTEKTIGVAPEYISVRLRDLCDDIRVQQQQHSFSVREMAARFHHRLVSIHPFPNGNGRFSRMMTDLLLVEAGEQPFAWGDGDLIVDGEVRNRYIAALREADAKNYGPLLNFLRAIG